MISKQQWEGIKTRIQGYDCVVFAHDGHKISVLLRRIAECELGYCVYIDGVVPMSIESSPDFNPLSKTFCRRIIRRPHATTVSKLKRERGGKRLLKDPSMAWVHRTYEQWVPWFTSAKLLIAQYRKIEGLELISEVDDAS